MELAKIVDKLSLQVAAGAGHLAHDAKAGYVSDLLSEVIANAQAGTLWVTIQTHANIAAVCSLNELAGVIIAHGKKPAPDLVTKAEAEGIPVLLSPLNSFELAGQLYKLGLRGSES